MRSNYHGGVNAKLWRKKIATLADSRKDVIKTLKFPLESESLPFPQSSANELYNVIEGVNKGSLIGFLCAIHLTGFRVFSSESRANSFHKKEKYPYKAFATALEEHYGVKNLNFTPESFETFCLKGGQEISVVIEMLV